MLTNVEFTAYVQRYLDTVYRVALNYIKSAADAEDVTQDVFLKLLQAKKPFESEEHVRNWLIRVTLNQCKNLVKARWWRQESYEDYAGTLSFDSEQQSELFACVMALPAKYRIPLYLHYYEKYTAEEIGEMLHISKNTVCSQLKRGREILKKTYMEAEDHV